MSVLIKRMEMPSGCLSCDFCNPFTDEPYCRRLMRRTPKVTRLEDCPLVPVPPHGRLIDADAICYQLEKLATIDGQPRAIRRARRMVESAPTIIPAEEVE